MILHFQEMHLPLFSLFFPKLVLFFYFFNRVYPVDALYFYDFGNTHSKMEVLKSSAHYRSFL